MSKISLQLVFQESDDKLRLEMDDDELTKTDNIKNPGEYHKIFQSTPSFKFLSFLIPSTYSYPSSPFLLGRSFYQLVVF